MVDKKYVGAMTLSVTKELVDAPPADCLNHP
jgi:hypothetical protein